LNQTKPAMSKEMIPHFEVTMNQYKYFSIVKMEPRQYGIYSNKGPLLGQIVFYAKWNCYVFESDSSAIWSSDCLEDIVAFLKKVNS